MKSFLTKLTVKNPTSWFLNSEKLLQLVLKCVLLLIIPYAWLFVLSAIFGGLFTVPEMAPFILYSSIVFLAINLCLLVWATVRYIKK